MKTTKEIAISLFGDSYKTCKCGGSHEVCLNCVKCRAELPDSTCNDVNALPTIIDATLLRANALNDEVLDLISTADKYNCASVCLNSDFIHFAKTHISNSLKTCSVVNFPLGASNSKALLGEVEGVLLTGIDELDMVQDIREILNDEFDNALKTIKDVYMLCNGKKVLLKVILETCYLTPEQIIISCLIAKKGGADFVKTSTGFGPSGATVENIKLMRETVGSKMGVKASGGIKTHDQAVMLIMSGANRIGASNVESIVQTNDF